MATLHTSEYPGLGLIRGPRLPQHPIGLVVTARRAFNVRCWQRPRYLTQHCHLLFLALVRDDLRRAILLVDSSALPAYELPILRKQEGLALLTEHEGTRSAPIESGSERSGWMIKRFASHSTRSSPIGPGCGGALSCAPQRPQPHPQHLRRPAQRTSAGAFGLPIPCRSSSQRASSHAR